MILVLFGGSVEATLLITILNMLAISSTTITPHSLSTQLKNPKCRRPVLPAMLGTTRSHHSSSFHVVSKKNNSESVVSEEVVSKEDVDDNVGEKEGKSGEILLCSVAPYPLMFAAALPGAETIRSAFGPIVEVIKSLNLPDWLIHWGHPGNMAVVLFAMGGYGTYLGFRIRLSKDAEEKAMAKDLHPKLLGGMFFFFALGATGGIMSLLTTGKPILESPHAVTGLIGLNLLTVQSILPSLFEENPGLRTAHGLFGSSIMAIFLIHAALGLQLGLSF